MCGGKPQAVCRSLTDQPTAPAEAALCQGGAGIPQALADVHLPQGGQGHVSSAGLHLAKQCTTRNAVELQYRTCIIQCISQFGDAYI